MNTNFKFAAVDLIFSYPSLLTNELSIDIVRVCVCVLHMNHLQCCIVYQI